MGLGLERFLEAENFSRCRDLGEGVNLLECTLGLRHEVKGVVAVR
jgi:hypothetical protein